MEVIDTELDIIDEPNIFLFPAKLFYLVQLTAQEAFFAKFIILGIFAVHKIVNMFIVN